MRQNVKTNGHFVRARAELFTNRRSENLSLI